MPNILELIKLLVVVTIPLWLLLTKRHGGLFVWLGITLGTEIFNVSIVANISPLNVFGLLYLPLAMQALPTLLSTRAGRLMGLSFLLLALLGFVYGYLFPWPDITGIRPINQSAEGRSIIYLVRTISELSVVIYIATMVQSPENIGKLLRYLLVGTSLAAFAVLVQWLSGVDVYALLVPSQASLPVDLDRLRGLSAEPRTSSQVLTWGILLLLGLSDLGLRRIILLFLHVVAFALTVSTTGLITLTVGSGLLIVWAPLKGSTKLATLLLLLSFVTVVQFIIGPAFIESWSTNVGQRLLVPRELDASRNIGEDVAGRLEVFDASALFFLLDNPEYFIFGTGPGLVSLPASKYIPSYARAIYGDQIDSVPHMGFFLLIANSGLVGLGLWLMLFWTCYQSVREKADTISPLNYWRESLTYFVVFSGIYLVQAKPIWNLFLGIGLGVVLSLNADSRDKPWISLPRARRSTKSTS